MITAKTATIATPWPQALDLCGATRGATRGGAAAGFGADSNDAPHRRQYAAPLGRTLEQRGQREVAMPPFYQAFCNRG